MKKTLPVFFVVMLIGCSTNDAATLLVPSDAPSGFTLISVNPSLQYSAQPAELRRSMAEDGKTPKFNLLLQNTTGEAQSLNYRVEWLDEQDTALRGQVDVARSITIPSGSVQSIISVAPSSMARRFRLWLTDVGNASAIR
jgi:uncharacterized protein YcfL